MIEAIFAFETASGRGAGVVRLPAEAPSRAYVLLTSLEELKGFEEKVDARRPSGEAYSRNFGGDNWLDQRVKSQAYADREPAVLVIGAGQAGLAVAARLGRMDVDTLVVERHGRVGDNWRKRYHSLALHNQIHVNHLPYMPFPPSWPKYIPKDMLADWFESYAWAMEINVWTGTEFVHGAYDAASGTWTAVLRQADGTERVMRPRHIIFANGVSGIPYIPELPGLDEFAGAVVHSHGFTDGAAWRGKRALVLGTGNSGHDVAQDLHSHGADTTIIQRGSTTVVSIDPSAKLNYALYDEDAPLEDCDLIATAATYPLLVRGYQLAVERMAEFDKELIAGLVARGFKHDWGEDGTGHQMKYRTARRRLLPRRRLRRADHQRRDRAAAIRPDRALRARGRAPQGRFGQAGGPPGAGDRLLHAARAGAPPDGRRRRGEGRPDLGLRRQWRDGQHVAAHGPGGPLVHGRQPRAVPDLLQIPRPADQGIGSRADRPVTRSETGSCT